MNEYLIGLVFTALGFVGATAHWYKKRYIDHTTECNFVDYIVFEPQATLYAAGTIIFAEISLAAITPGITLGAIVGALTVGYTSDSALNRAPDA